MELNIQQIHKYILSNKQIPNKEFYLLDTLEILEQYNELLKIPIRIQFFSNIDTDQLNKTNDTLHQKHELTLQYMKKIKEYKYDKYIDLSEYEIPINNEMDKNIKICNKCKSKNFAESTDIEGIIICIDCGYQDITIMNSMITHDDSKRINIITKYTYDKKSHFINCCNQFQGKSKNVINKNIIDKIRDELIKYNIINGDDTLRVTKEHITIFLKELKMTKYYGDINYIYHKITNIPLHDLSSIMDKLLIDFEQFVKCHNKNFPQESEQKNFNYQLLLYQLLMKNGYKCNPTEFNFLKTTDRKSYHDEKCRKIFEELAWNYTSLF